MWHCEAEQGEQQGEEGAAGAAQQAEKEDCTRIAARSATSCRYEGDGENIMDIKSLCIHVYSLMSDFSGME